MSSTTESVMKTESGNITNAVMIERNGFKAAWVVVVVFRRS